MNWVGYFLQGVDEGGRNTNKNDNNVYHNIIRKNLYIETL